MVRANQGLRFVRGDGPVRATTLAVDQNHSATGRPHPWGHGPSGLAFVGRALVALALFVAVPVAGVGILAAAAGCATPTLPLPPPTEPSITASTVPGKVHLHGVQSVTPNAIVIAYNQNPSVKREERVTATLSDEFGSWDMDVTASPGDVIDITQESSNTSSPSVQITVPASK